VRIVADEFKPNSTQRRLVRKNSDLVVRACKPWSTDEQFTLLQRYLSARHPNGGMTEMDEIDFADMVEQTPVETYVIEYREPGADGQPGKLVGACLTDKQGDGLSMIYSFFDPDTIDRNGLGSFIIVDHVLRAQRSGLPYVYLGYWVEGSERMNYKIRYQPIEKLGRAGWERFDPPASGTGAPGGAAAGHEQVLPRDAVGRVLK
jgi:arginine-tRNA-protein transferase